MAFTTDLGNNVYQIDLVSADSLYRATGYLIKEKKIILIETGASPSNVVIQQALKELDITLEMIDLVAVTHIHLDHSGGAGLLMSQCPNAKLLVHEKGKKHLVDPEKLIAGARVVYGDRFDEMFDPICPIPEDRVEIVKDKEEIDLGNNRSLTFLDTPGHAFHHLAIYDPKSNGLFSGDSAGIFFHRLFRDHKIPFCLPVTAPTQFVPDIMEKTLRQLIDLSPRRIYFTHFGVCECPEEILELAIQWTQFFGKDCVDHYHQHQSAELLSSFILNRIQNELNAKGAPDEFPESSFFAGDVALNVQGIIAYVEKMKAKDSNV